MKIPARFTLVVVLAFAVEVTGPSLSRGMASRSRVAQDATAPVTVSDHAPFKPLAGQSSTLLPNGKWLMLGGEGDKGPVQTGVIVDPKTGSATPLSNQLGLARAWHTATMLPDGRVLILGGVGNDGHLVDMVEVFDPESQRFQFISSTDFTPRAHHSATLLTDGRVLIAGGASMTGETLGTVQLWDTKMQVASSSDAELQTPRRDHSASLLPDGRVLLWGGKAANDEPLKDGELFDPQSESFSPIEDLPAQAIPPGETARLFGSIPADGDHDVPTDGIIALRFSRPLQVDTVTSKTVTLIGPEGAVGVKVVPAEDGLLAFVNPREPLAPLTNYSLRLLGSRDTNKRPVSPTEINFITGNTQALGQEPLPGQESNSDVSVDSPWQKIPSLQAATGVTAIAGQVLKLNGRPLPNVTLMIGTDRSMMTMTDRTGRFLLPVPTLPSGHYQFTIDGASASVAGKTYGMFCVRVDITAGTTNVLPYTIWMPVIDTHHLTRLPVPTTSEVVATTPLIPGLELHVPPGVVIREMDGSLATSLTITPVSMTRPPFPLPPGIKAPVYFTTQPGASMVESSGADDRGIRIVFPNRSGWPAGLRVNFWSYDPQGVGWFVYGQGTVTPDGKQVVPDPGVAVHRLTCGFIGPAPGPPPSTWPINDATDGEPVDLSTGLFVYRKTDFYLPDVIPIIFTRVYRPGDNSTPPRSFGIGTSHSYNMVLYFGDTGGTDLILPDGQRIFYPSGGPTPNIHTATPTIFYGSTLGNGGEGSGESYYTITLKDGTVYYFLNYKADFQGPNQYYSFLSVIQDRHGNQLTITRDDNDDQDITAIQSPNGRTLQFTYDGSSRITQIQDNIGRTTRYTYDSGGRLSTATDTNGGVTTFTYDSSNEMLTVTDPRSIVYVTNAYDSNGRVTKQTLADKSTYQFSYTLSGSSVTQTNVTDPLGIVRQVTFNSSGYRLTDTYAVGKPEQQAYAYTRQAGSNFVLTATDALSRQTAYTYDSKGNVTSVTQLAGTSNAVTTSYTYEPTFSQVASATDPLNHTTNFSYDAMDNLIALTDALQHQWMFTYNGAGQPLSAKDPLSNTTQFTYSGGDLVGVTDPQGNRASQFIDAAGRLISLADPLGNTTQYTYDAVDQLTQVIDPSSGVTKLSYDGNGNISTVTDARNNATSYTYDNRDRLTSRKDPLLRSESYQYDADGNTTQFSDRRGKVNAFTYDNLNRRTFAGFGQTKSGKNYVYESTINYAYDAGNRVTQAADSLAGTITRSYDGLDRLTSEGTLQGSVSYVYDAGGRRTSMTVAGQAAVSYTYDNGNRLTGMTQGSSTVNLAYDTANRRTTLTLPNGVQVAYSYDTASQLTGLTYTLGTTTLGNLTYSYDSVGRRTSLGGSFARTGLPLAVASATYDAANELTKWGSGSPTYDANGNLTNDGLNTYTWDARNQLKSIVAGSTNIGSFQYDAFSRRWSKTVAGTTTLFLYDRVNAIQELSPGTPPTPTANLLAGLGVDEVLTRTDSATRNFLTDALGSTVALTDSSGTIQTQYTYDPFGNTSFAGPANTNSFQFAGRENDGTGLYYYRARYYDPAFGRFVSEDPIRFAGGADFYVYVWNSPVGLIDPFGLDALGEDIQVLRNIFPRSDWQPANNALVIHFPCRQVRETLLAQGYQNANSWGYNGPLSAFWNPLPDPYGHRGGWEWRTFGPGFHFRMQYDQPNPFKKCANESCTLDQFHIDPHNPIDGQMFYHVVCDLLHLCGS